jgi:hypothetical protein
VVKEAFDKSHPSLEEFVVGIKEESKRMMSKIEAVKNRQDVPLDHNDLNNPEIPISYIQFKRT